MRELVGAEGGYEARCGRLVENGIALWDVLHSSVRPGSLDADIRSDAAIVNDFGGFFQRHVAIELIAFNGKKAGQLFERFVDARVGAGIRCVGLPSTSPAYASMSFSDKVAAWREALTRTG